MLSDLEISGVKATITYPEGNLFFYPGVEVDVLAGYANASGEYLVIRFPFTHGWKPWDCNARVDDKFDYIGCDHAAYIDHEMMDRLGAMPPGGEIDVRGQKFFKKDWS